MEFFMARVLWTKSYINCHCVRWGAKKKPKSFPLQKFGVCACQLLGAQAVGRSENLGVAEAIRWA